MMMVVMLMVMMMSLPWSNKAGKCYTELIKWVNLRIRFPEPLIYQTEIP